jgi:hypothetical protein
MVVKIGHEIRARFYATARVKGAESHPDFESERAKIVQPDPAVVERAILAALTHRGPRPQPYRALASATGHDVTAVRAALMRMAKRGDVQKHDVGDRRVGFTATVGDEMPAVVGANSPAA